MGRQQTAGHRLGGNSIFSEEFFRKQIPAGEIELGLEDKGERRGGEMVRVALARGGKQE